MRHLGERTLRLVATLMGASAIGFVGPAVSVGAAVQGCKMKIEQSAPQAPERPKGVPENALWTGGVDGGVFLIVKPVGAADPDAYFSEIYHDYSGERLYRGRLLMRPARSGPFPIGEAASYSAWDGTALYLADGRRLITATKGG